MFKSGVSYEIIIHFFLETCLYFFS